MTSSWKKQADWYDQLVSDEGHYYHKQIILPGSLHLLNLQEGDRLLDLGCGQGVLARALPQGVDYVGIDGSKPLIEKAKGYSTHRFMVADLTQSVDLQESFTHAAFILSLQNIADPSIALKTASKHLIHNGVLVIALNHPCFRIPRQSHWGLDEAKKLQYRRVDRYLTPLTIPIHTHPGKTDTKSSLSYHWPLSKLSELCFAAHLMIEKI